LIGRDVGHLWKTAMKTGQNKLIIVSLRREIPIFDAGKKLNIH